MSFSKYALGLLTRLKKKNKKKYNQSWVWLEFLWEHMQMGQKMDVCVRLCLGGGGLTKTHTAKSKRN